MECVPQIRKGTAKSKIMLPFLTTSAKEAIKSEKTFCFYERKGLSSEANGREQRLWKKTSTLTIRTAERELEE